MAGLNIGPIISYIGPIEDRSYIHYSGQDIFSACIQY